MNILITQSVTAAAEIFQGAGQLRFVPDSDLEHTDLTDIDAVIMRSQSHVTAKQVKGTRVKFIGSATAGLDHLPVDALRALGIRVVNAPGCNANSVADYWLSAVLSLGRPFHGKTLGIVGYGEVGQRVAKRAVALGLKVVVNDPPRVVQQLSTVSGTLSADLPADTKRASTSTCYADIPYPTVSLSELVGYADIISLHVPLTTTGPWPTAHLINAALLAKLKPGATLINTARGEVCDTQALVAAKNQGLIADLMIDVWPHEPDIDLALWHAATIATPHIAGHSYMAKWQGTWQVYEALVNTGAQSLVQRDSMLDCHVDLRSPRHDSQMKRSMLSLYNSRDDVELIDLWYYVQQVYDVTQDHLKMQTWLALPVVERIQAFSQYRRDYPRRGELSIASVEAASLTPWQCEVLLSAGVTLN